MKGIQMINTRMKIGERVRVKQFVSGTLAVSVVVALSISGCHSGDLGAEKPDRVNVDLSLSSWDSGAGQVITQKCANCHTSHRSASVPANTPDVLNEIDSPDFFTKADNRPLIRAMRKRIESADPKRQMPPRFATPLYEDEKAAVLGFLKMIENAGASTSPCKSATPVNSQSNVPSSFADSAVFAGIYRHGDDHGDDHGNDASNSASTGVSNPCNQPQPVPSPDPTPIPTPIPTPGVSVTFKDIAPIVAKSCGGCHDGTAHFSLLTREDFVAVKPTPLDEIMAGSMPRRNPGWKDTDEGKLVIQWLQGSQEE